MPVPILAVALALGLSACSATGESGPASLVSVPPPMPEKTEPGRGPGHWWRETGDPLLARLVDHGLAADRDLQCEALALRNQRQRASDKANRIDIRLRRMIDSKNADTDQAVRNARAFRHAGHRADLAARIASAYIEVRRLQEVLDLRRKMQSQFKDNAEIAAFRREAGLAPGVDQELAGSFVTLREDSIAADEARLAQAIAALAGLTGTTPEILQTDLGETGTVPDIAASPELSDNTDVARRTDLLELRERLAARLIQAKVPPEILTQDNPTAGLDGEDADVVAAALAEYGAARDQDRAEVARLSETVEDVTRRQATLSAKVGDARRTAEAARLGYRSGAGGFPALYVAEVAALGTEEARVHARADLALATIRLWTGMGGGWTNDDLAPDVPVTPAGEVLVCE